MDLMSGGGWWVGGWVGVQVKLVAVNIMDMDVMGVGVGGCLNNIGCH